MIILIPAYEPDHKLIALLRSITEAQPDVEVVLVDDGSGPDHASLFLRASELGGLVLTHPVNRGKGAALRTGFAWIAGHRPGQVVVCADCDGQHTATDILKVGDATTASIAVGRPSIVLGARHFTGRVPFRSRFGNGVTRGFFALATGIRLRDTQTGLRGYPASMLDWLGTIEGDRFEYELNTLLQAKPGGHPIVEVPIATIYLDENASSHFRPIQDSARIYAPLLTFTASSLMGFGIDLVAVLVLQAIFGNLLVSVVGARLLSSAANFLVNRNLVFDRTGRSGRATSAGRYAGLAVLILAANYGLMWLLTGPVSAPLLVAKVLTELTLFGFSYAAQQRYVFRPDLDAGTPLVTGLAAVQPPQPITGSTAADQALAVGNRGRILA